MTIQHNIPLAPLTTLGVGGPARHFASITSEVELLEALTWARERQLPVAVLGGGSNLLVSDEGFDGLVVQMAIPGIDADGQGGYRVGGGVEWDTFVARAVNDGAAGVECLAGIPGRVGATPVQNVGAYGQDVSETIRRVRAIELATLEAVEFTAAECDFHYRRSRFNGADLHRFLLTRVDFQLAPGGVPKLTYADLKRHFNRQLEEGGIPSLPEVSQAVLEIRGRKGMVVNPEDPDSRSAGSFFKNPQVSQGHFEQIADGFSIPVPHFAAADGEVKLPAAWLIEQAGIPRGFVLGRAGISRKHTLALINRGGATAGDILDLARYVQQCVEDRFGVILHPEPVMLGFAGK